jgi:hypothetical protein
VLEKDAKAQHQIIQTLLTKRPDLKRIIFKGNSQVNIPEFLSALISGYNLVNSKLEKLKSQL